MASRARDDEMICALTAEQHDELQKRLRDLNDTMPPRAVWQRICEQAEAEGLVKGAATKQRTVWMSVTGLAAAAALAAMMLPALLNKPTETFPVVPANLPTNTTQLTALQTLMVESRQLEDDLRSLPDAPSVMRAGTIATISELENRIAAIDYQLNDPEVQMAPADRELFWRERVRLMKLLLQLRYAQAQRAAF
ncbi:MAG: hypothetical protein KJO46_00570 [Gammaproteobacteria bacterium]|nr:hypothetical protein [Gammaproteobacteria bacterium]